jgi:hypothetical protein
LDKTLVSLNRGLTLVSPDGSRILSLATKATDDPDVASTSGTTLGSQKVPAGTWYIAPGDFVASPAQTRLIDRLANGESPQNVPKIVAVANQIVSLDFDAKDAEHAILAP